MYKEIRQLRFTGTKIKRGPLNRAEPDDDNLYDDLASQDRAIRNPKQFWELDGINSCWHFVVLEEDFENRSKNAAAP